MEYHREFPDLAGVLLEDSWVLDVAPHDQGITFRLDAVLTPENPSYRSPCPGELHCYRRAWLSIESDGQIDIALSGPPPAKDTSGETDLGHIDLFRRLGDGRWLLDGDWGSATVVRPKVSLILD